MEFFTIAQYAEMSMEPQYWRFAFIYGAVGFVILFTFQAIALYTIATHNGLRHRWMAFVPILSTYYIGVCARKNRIFGLDSKVVGTIVASFEFLLLAGYVMHYVGFHFVEPYIEYEMREIYGVVFLEPTIDSSVGQELAWAVFCFDTLGVILDAVHFVYLIMQVMLLYVFFQTYAARRCFLFTICCVFLPIQGIFFFAVRKNKGMSYREYVVREQERRYRMYRQYNQENRYNTNNQNNPNSQYDRSNYGENPYDYGGAPRPEQKNEDPFEEFGHSDDDPFGN